jgi:hypothetical protein
MRFELRDGKFGGGSSQGRWEASSIDDKSFNFGQVTKYSYTYSYSYRRESESSFIVRVLNPVYFHEPASQEMYRMERWPRR